MAKNTLNKHACPGFVIPAQAGMTTKKLFQSFPGTGPNQ